MFFWTNLFLKTSIQQLKPKRKYYNVNLTLSLDYQMNPVKRVFKPISNFAFNYSIVPLKISIQ